MPRRNLPLAAVVVLSLSVPSGALAQLQTGTILVKAVDEQGAAMPGVTLTITSASIIAGQVEGVTDSVGIYRLRNLVSGTYTVRAALAGFQSIELRDIVVSVGQTTPIDLT